MGDLDSAPLLRLREDIGENYDAVVRSVAAAVGAQACSLALYDPEREELIARRPSYRAPAGPVPKFRFPLESSPSSAHVVRTGQPYLANDPGSDPLFSPSVREGGLRSILTVPIRAGGRILGLLYALNKPGGFTFEDARTLTALAGAAAVTLHNVHLYAEERGRRILHETLSEVSRILLAAPVQEAALAAVLDQMWRVVRYEGALAVLLEGERLRVAASRGGEAGVEIPLARAGDLARVVRAREPAILADAAALLPALGLHGIAGTALAAPLLAEGEVLGVFLVVFDRPPGPGEGRLVSAFAEHAALFLAEGAVLRRERQARARAAAVERITRMAATRHEPESLLQAVGPELLALSGADRAVLYLKDPGGAVLVPVADAGTALDEEERVREHRMDLTARALGPLAEGRPALLEAESHPPPGSITVFPDARSLLAVPLVSRQELLGAVVLAWLGRSQACDGSLIESLGDVARQVALGVENARLFSRLAQLASTDELTGLANRRRFTEAFRLELARSCRAGTPLALVLADVDHLKRVNDTYGHPAGDGAIRHVADALRRGHREIDLAARLGGEEFALILPGTDRSGAVKAAERIRRDLAESSIPVVGTVTVSMGVAACPEDGSSEEDLIRLADERLYAAKSGGRNRVCGRTVPGTHSGDGPLPPPRVRPALAPGVGPSSRT